MLHMLISMLLCAEIKQKIHFIAIINIVDALPCTHGTVYIAAKWAVTYIGFI